MYMYDTHSLTHSLPPTGLDVVPTRTHSTTLPSPPPAPSSPPAPQIPPMSPRLPRSPLPGLPRSSGLVIPRPLRGTAARRVAL